MMQIDLNGALVDLIGHENTVSAAAMQALLDNGGRQAAGAASLAPDIILVSFPLVPQEGLEPGLQIAAARRIAEAMTPRGGGSLLFLLSAAAGMPMRRHPDYSVQMAAALAGMRTIAMSGGPLVRANALGIGLVGDDPIAGDAAMLSHTAVGRPGALAEICDTVLFFCDPANTYTTGQMLCVDGGWSAGYGRNF